MSNRNSGKNYSSSTHRGLLSCCLGRWYMAGGLHEDDVHGFSGAALVDWGPEQGAGYLEVGSAGRFPRGRMSSTGLGDLWLNVHDLVREISGYFAGRAWSVGSYACVRNEVWVGTAGVVTRTGAVTHETEAGAALPRGRSRRSQRMPGRPGARGSI